MPSTVRCGGGRNTARYGAATDPECEMREEEMPKNRYVKVSLFEKCSTRLQDSKVVGQGDDYLLLERPQPKPRAEAKKVVRKARKVQTAPAAETVNA